MEWDVGCEALACIISIFMTRFFLYVGLSGNERLQEMMSVMAKERGGVVYGMDSRYCIDNGGMIAQAGILEYQNYQTTPLEKTRCTQR